MSRAPGSTPPLGTGEAPLTPPEPAARCSALSARDEPLAGTATRVGGWVCLEHPSPWGRDVLDGTALGPALTPLLRERLDAAGLRLMLIRRHGREGAAIAGGRTVYLAQSHPAHARCARLTVDSPWDLLELDLSWAAPGPHPGPPPGRPVTDPVTLVCTHGRRDVCCAIGGRPIAGALSVAGALGGAALPPALAAHVWECSHTGGHRFAPSMIVLPTGYSYGRVTAAEAADAVRGIAAGRLPGAGLRGRSCWDARGQVAELAVRRLLAGEHVPLGALAVVDPPRADDGERTVVHRDGRRWRASTRTERLPPRAASCGAAPKPVTAAHVTGVEPVSVPA